MLSAGEYSLHSCKSLARHIDSIDLYCGMACLLCQTGGNAISFVCAALFCNDVITILQTKVASSRVALLVVIIRVLQEQH